MSRGGRRPGAGRPRSRPSKSEDQYPAPVPVLDDIARAALKAGMSPLEYMLGVMRNPEADQTRRDRMAQAAAPFCHPRMADNRFGKKDAQVEAALTAGHGSDWADDLDYAGDGGKPN